MLEITHLIGQFLESDSLEKVAKQVKIEPSTVQSISKEALPILIKQIGKNTTLKTKQKKLEKAIESKNLITGKIDVKDGIKMLDHIFPNKQKIVLQIAEKLWIKEKSVLHTLWALAPSIMWILWEAQSQWMSFWQISEKLMDLSENKTVLSLFDKNKDGDVKDDFIRWAISFLKKTLLWKK